MAYKPYRKWISLKRIDVPETISKYPVSCGLILFFGVATLASFALSDGIIAQVCIVLNIGLGAHVVAFLLSARRQAHRESVERRAARIKRAGVARVAREEREVREQARARGRERERREEQAAKVREAARCEERTQARLRELIVRFEPFPDYADDEFLETYARRHQHALLRDEAAILSEQQQLHESPEFLELLKDRAPDTYERAMWRVRALAIAKRLDLEVHAPTPPPSIMEVKVRELEDRAGGEIELAEVRLRKVSELRQRLEQHEELDPETREMMIQRFAQSLEPADELPGTVY